ncbi:MAG: hypothetical protein KA216_03585 [Giesbergeria sp.]|nr:hypothetical protein [Giesbergeria sp.]
MNRNLNARQRAMLEAMGVQVWSPKPAPVVAAVPVVAAAHAASAPVARPASPRAASPRAAPLTATATAAAPSSQLHWVLQAPQPLYPDATNATPSTNAAPRWLLVAEGMADVHPLAGDAGTLLDNMLHALGLRQQPQVFICLLTPVAAEAASGSSASTSTAANYSQVLTEAAAALQPAVVLLMGRAARAVLGRSEPLGQLRPLAHHIANVPAVVTYDAPYLLRAPYTAKAATWDDLCRARALVQAPPG